MYKGELLDEKKCAIKYFKNEPNHKILVMDPNGLVIDTISNKLGQNINFIFKTTGGVKTNVYVNQDITIDRLLKYYLYQVGGQEYIENTWISFIYNANQLKFGDKRKLKDAFKTGQVTITVNFLG